MEKEKKKSKGKWIIIAIVVIAIIVIAASGSDDDEVKEVKSNTTQAAKSEDKAKEDKETEKTEFNVGDTAEYKDIQISLTKVTESKGDGEFVKPEDGKVWLICSFEIKNNSSDDITMSSIGCFEAYCDDVSINDDYMGMQAPEAKGQNTLDGDVASGKKMKGAIAYEVPKDWKKLEVNVKPSFWSSKDIKFIVKNK